MLATSLAAGAALVAGHYLAADAAPREADPNHVVLLSDLHVAGNRSAKERDVVMFDNARRAVDGVLGRPKMPAFVVVNGDCAHHFGSAKDYEAVLDVLAPMRRAGLPIHLALGNHDDRGRFLAALVNRDAVAAAAGSLAGRHVSIIETRRANLFILDTLGVTNVPVGSLGEKQVAWLAAALDARPDKPAIVFTHHQPDYRADPKGLADTRALVEVLAPRKQVKAHIFGHTHRYGFAQADGLHLLNLPAVAYVFRPTDPSGWMDLRLADGGATFQLHTLDPAHPLNGAKTELAWR